MSDNWILPIVAAFLAFTGLVAWAGLRRGELVLGILAVLGVASVAFGLAFTAAAFGVSGPLIVGVQLVGLGFLGFMLYRHWKHHPGHDYHPRSGRMDRTGGLGYR